MKELKNKVLEELKKIRTPIISDAMELFGIRPNNIGSMDNTIQCLLPDLGILVGYACTGRIYSEFPCAKGEKKVDMKEVLKYIDQSNKPNIMVVQDLDSPPRKGCAWGDLSASMFKSHGCIGTVTNGNVRDIDEVEKIGFKLFAAGPTVGHSYIRYVEIGVPVKVGGLIVNHGDLLHGDKHGVLVIPGDIDLEELIKVSKKFLNSEKSVIDYCQSEDISFQKVYEKLDEHNTRCDGGHLK